MEFHGRYSKNSCRVVDFEGIKGKAKAITPVPGGVGPMTIAFLMMNTVIAACLQKGVDASNFIS